MGDNNIYIHTIYIWQQLAKQWKNARNWLLVELEKREKWMSEW